MKQRERMIVLKRMFLSSENRKPFFRLVYDLIHWVIIRKGGLFFFYIYKLERRDHVPGDYITISEYNKIHDKLDPKYYRPLLEDKIIFDRYIKSFGIPSPEMLGIIDSGLILWLDNTSYEPIESIVERPIHAYCKQVTSFGGKNVFKIDVESGILQINNKPATAGDLISILGRRKYILQRTIVQHDELNRLNPSCVNTIRVYTISNGSHPVFFRSAIRMGVDNSIVDNVSSNNMVTGILENHFLQDFAHSGTSIPEWYQSHPNTKVKFSQFKVPFLSEAYNLCCDVHRYFGDFFFVAWDVAITPDGPVILEGNPAADLFGSQALYGGQKSRFLQFANKYSAAKSLN